VLDALQYGPVVVAFHASKSFRFYKDGIFTTNECSSITLRNINHCVVVVGYNKNANIPYFEVLNSWGENWGDKGFFKIKVGNINRYNKGLCFITGTPYMIAPYLK
jgi:C1A family cysteine protease